MHSKKKLLENFNLYAITDIEKYSSDILVKIDRALKGGAGIIQLRSKHLTDKEMIRLGTKVREIARVHGKGFIVNDRVDIALAVNADGVHLGQEDLPVAFAKEMIHSMNASLSVGVSTHSLAQALQAEEDGADYIGVGPVFGTPTKPDYAPVGIELIQQVKNKIRTPFLAIGGISETNMTEVIEAGARCIAVVRAIFASEDAFYAAQKLREKYESLKKELV